MRHVILIAYDQFSDISVEQRVLGEISAQIQRVDSLEDGDVAALLSEASALMVTIQDVSAELLERMENCKIVSRVGTGVDSIDIEAATAQGIWVTNVPDYAVDEVATHTVTLLLALARRLPAWMEATRQGLWDGHVGRPIYRLSGQTIGLVGFGRIGKATAKKATGLGLRVLVNDPFVEPAEIVEHGAEPADWQELWRTSDYVSLHAPLNEKTKGMVDRGTLSLMKDGSYLINTARGALVDEGALKEALDQGQIAGAALDVMSDEPPPTDHPFLRDRRVIITPHIGWYSEHAGDEVRVKAARDVVRVLSGMKPSRPVNAL